jgi:hypothetical protein
MSSGFGYRGLDAAFVEELAGACRHRSRRAGPAASREPNVRKWPILEREGQPTEPAITLDHRLGQESPTT